MAESQWTNWRMQNQNNCRYFDKKCPFIQVCFDLGYCENKGISPKTGAICDGEMIMEGRYNIDGETGFIEKLETWRERIFKI